MTREEAIANHRKMWRWIADQTERRQCVVKKTDYFDAMGIHEEDRPLSNCYCCEYINNRNDADCDLCPIEWPDGHCGNDSLYAGWFAQTASSYGDWREAAALARQIAELPEKEEVIE